MAPELTSPGPARSSSRGNSVNTVGGYPLAVGGSPIASPISRCACAKRVRLSMRHSTRLPWSRKYSLRVSVRNAACRRIRAASSEVATTTTARLIPASPRYSVTNSCTSRPRSPISPTTATSAVAFITIIDISTDLPTPEPAKMPMRWPSQIVVKVLSTRTPMSSGPPTRARLCAGRGCCLRL